MIISCSTIYYNYIQIFDSKMTANTLDYMLFNHLFSANWKVIILVNADIETNFSIL